MGAIYQEVSHGFNFNQAERTMAQRVGASDVLLGQSVSDLLTSQDSVIEHFGSVSSVGLSGNMLLGKG